MSPSLPSFPLPSNYSPNPTSRAYSVYIQPSHPHHPTTISPRHHLHKQTTMSLSKQDMKYLANGKVVTEEALIAIAAAKRDDFEKWCEARQFQHFLMRTRLGSPSDPMTLPRLQKWAADEMFHLRVSLSSGVQCTHANIYVQSLQENRTYMDGKLGQDTTSRVHTNKKNTANVEEGPQFIDDDLIAFA